MEEDSLTITTISWGFPYQQFFRAAQLFVFLSGRQIQNSLVQLPVWLRIDFKVKKSQVDKNCFTSSLHLLVFDALETSSFVSPPGKRTAGGPQNHGPWNWRLTPALNMVIFGIYVKFLGRKSSPKAKGQSPSYLVHPPSHKRPYHLNNIQNLWLTFHEILIG